MTWAVWLSHYPRALFTDDLPLLILALLDRTGLVTEAELAQQASASEATVRDVLLKLHLNNMVEYSSAHVRLNEVGRTLLDRLGLYQEVAQDVIDSLNLRDEDRADYHTLLESFRRSSFRLYQNSLCTMRQWT